MSLSYLTSHYVIKPRWYTHVGKHSAMDWRLKLYTWHPISLRKTGNINTSPSILNVSKCTQHVFVTSMRATQNRYHFADGIFKCIFLNENASILLKICLRVLFSRTRINTIPALFEIMAWRRPGNKQLSETMMVSLLTHICVMRHSASVS